VFNQTRQCLLIAQSLQTSKRYSSAMLHSEKFKEIPPTKTSRNFTANAKQTRNQYQAYSAEEPTATSALSSALKHTQELHPALRTREQSTPACSPLQGMRQQASRSPKPEDSMKMQSVYSWRPTWSNRQSSSKSMKLWTIPS